MEIIRILLKKSQSRMCNLGNRESPHRPDQNPEATDLDLDKILNICLDSQEIADTKI
jgi:hypothetical protein